MLQEGQVTFRRHTDDDIPFIQSSWLNSYRAESKFAHEIPKDIFFRFHHEVVERILNRKTASTIIATVSDAPDLIMGYASFEEMDKYRILHYIYIKGSFQGLGLSYRLLEQSPFPIENEIYASHLTRNGKKILDKYNLKFCPYLI